MGLHCHIEPAHLDEVQLPGEEPAAFALRSARDKAMAVAVRVTGRELSRSGSERPATRSEHRPGESLEGCASDPSRGLPVLGADTVVEVDGLALGKPTDPADAAAMLRRLSGRTHQVHTGVALVAGDRCESLVDTASVRFRPLDDPTIDWYVASGEPTDKAGAYAIQGRGGMLVDGIDGSPNTVIGLPLHRLSELFDRLDMNLWSYLWEQPGPR